MHVIGTAGHVDHGKSTLVKALSGIDPDRLKEEQKREMTIDLGFAWMTLPDGQAVGIIDVPGHIAFIENMLAGVGSIEMVILVVAADEGVMPQTREHLAILDLLGIHAGVVALTKMDLVKDKEWLELVIEDVKRLLADTTLENAKIIPVSARSGVGLDELISQIQTILEQLTSRKDSGKPRLYIDRIFSLPGFGTVVTGTLLDGKLIIGDEVEILPEEIRGRIRGLQTHKEDEKVATLGSRTAVNIVGVEIHQIKRGDVLVYPGKYRSTRRLDVAFNLLSNARSGIKHNTQVKFFLASAEINARIRLLGQEEIQPGEKGYIQLELDTPTIAVKGDRYILRRPSPAETLGGGMVLDPLPAKRHRRFDAEVFKSLHLLEVGSPLETLLQTSLKCGPMPLEELFIKSNLTFADHQEMLKDMLSNHQLVMLEDDDPLNNLSLMVVSQDWLKDFQRKIMREFENYFSKYPLRMGMRKDQIKNLSKFPEKIIEVLKDYLLKNKILQGTNKLVSPFGRKIQFSMEQSRSVESLIAEFVAHPYDPPSVDECIQLVGKEVYQALLDMCELIQVSKEVVFRSQDYQKMKAETLSLLNSNGSITLAEVRDLYQTSRRFALAFLEHMDAIGLTIREGDVRRLKNRH